MLNHTRTQQYILIIASIAVSLLYYISSCYINTSNDGSHYALVSAMVNKHTVIINDYVKYTGFTDYAVKDGLYYSDRLPGNAFLMTPFFLFGNLLQALHLDNLSNHIPIQEVTVILLPNLCGVFGVLFLFLLFRHLNFSFRLSLFTAILFAVCTLNWQEATHVFSHAPSMLFVLMAIYFLIRTPDIYSKQFYLFVFLLSFSSIIELQNSLLFLPALVYLLQTKKLDLKPVQKNIKPFVYSAFIICTVFSMLVLYNYIAFGEIMLKSNKYNPEFPEEQSFISSLSGDFVSGIDRLFTNILNPELWFNLELGTKNDVPGMFVSTPLLILSLIGFPLFFYKRPKEALLFTFIIAINVLIGAFHKTVLIRHIFTITPFFFFSLIFLIQYVIEKKSLLLSMIFYSILAVLAVASCFRVYYITHTYWGRELRFPLPFTKELGVYLCFAIFVSAILFIFIKTKKRIIRKAL